MFSRLLKTRLRQVSLLGGLALVVGTLMGVGLAFQPDSQAASPGDQFLQGTYIMTFLIPDRAQQIPCHLTADPFGTQVKGSLVCTQVQVPVDLPGGAAFQPANVFGSWEKLDDNRYFIGAMRTYFKQDSMSFVGRGVASGVFTRDGDTFSGTFTAKIEDADGNVLQRFPVPAELTKVKRSELEVTSPESE